MRTSVRTFAVLAALVALSSSQTPLAGQQPPSIAVNAFGAALGAWPGRVDAMVRDGTLAAVRQQVDTMLPNRTHERLYQRHAGLPVFGGQIVRQRSGAAVVSITGRLFENVDVPSASPSISAGDAQSLAAADAGPGAVGGAAELGILPLEDRFVLVYRLTVRTPTDVRRYDVDATTGLVVQSRSELRGEGIVGVGTGVLGDQKKVSAERVTGAFQLVDLLRPGGPITFGFDGSIGRLNAFFVGGTLFDSDIARDSNNEWTDRAAVDAHVHSGWTQDYFFKRFGRNGLDDANLEMFVIVHPIARSLAPFLAPEISGAFLNNAQYLCCGFGITIYGDGDGLAFDYLSGGFDVVAHEWTHGVTEFSSGLEYFDEHGALNEAFSDIMATGAEFMFLKPGQGPQKGPNFVLGEDVTLFAPGYLRSMQSPATVDDPDHYSLRRHIGTPVDNGGVHINSSIVNHAFYLAVAGGTNRVSGIAVQGIGVASIADMERIFYRAFVFMLGPLSNFSDARAATLQAASELFGPGSNQRAQLLAAWTAVGVL